MLRDIVVFERDERHTDTGKAELDFRLVRGALPTGSVPLAIADRHGFTAVDGACFTSAEVKSFAAKQSGYRSTSTSTSSST